MRLDTGTAKSTDDIFGNSQANQAFSREAYVGFSGGFGEVKLGKVWTAYDDVSGASNAVFDSALAPMNNVFRSTAYLGNPGNTIYYSTPVLQWLRWRDQLQHGRKRHRHNVGRQMSLSRIPTSSA